MKKPLFTKDEKKQLRGYSKDVQKLIVETRANHVNETEPIHAWFQLSYANYLAIPRSVLQSAPLTWQRRFVALLDELDAMFDWRHDGGVSIQARNAAGKIIRDKFVDYERGRRRIPIKDNSIIPPFASKKQRLAFLREFFPVFAKPEEIDAKQYLELAQLVAWGTRVKV